MAVQSYSEYRQRATETLQSLAADLLARRQSPGAAAKDVPAADEIKSLTLAALTKIGATKATTTEGEPSLYKWQTEANQAALTRSLEVVVEESAENDKVQAGHLADVLDIVLSAAEDGYIDDTVPLTVLAGLLELRPVSECESVLEYIETRISRLTLGMEYQRGRGPILLRLLNDLLRRLPRSQSHSVILSGRILMLLSWVYPLNEKSGVNLRGNFNVGKGFSFAQDSQVAEGEEKDATPAKDGGRGHEGVKRAEEATKMEVEEGEEAEETKEGDASADPATFYSTFWSLQRYFINPPLLFHPPVASTSAAAAPFPSLREGVRSTLLAFNAATKKAKDLAGSAKESSTSAAPKGGAARGAGTGGATGEDDDGGDDDDDDEMDASEKALEEYFFPKFLTSPDLLELELADPSFRRQILVQILILFHYLLGFSPAERSRTEKLPVTNMSAYPAYVLPKEVEAWVRELRSRTLDELDAMEGGRRFRKAVQLVLQRDQNWIDWKLRSCASFLLPPVDAVAQSEKARNKLRATVRKPKRYPYSMGNANLSRTWEKNLTSLDNFQPDIADDELSFILREYRLEKNRIKQQEAQLARAAPASPQRYEIEQALEQRRTRLQALHWRAIRSASTQYLRFFSQIGAGDLEKLEGLVDEERRKREDDAEAAEAARASGEKPEEEETVMAPTVPTVEYDSDTSVLKMSNVETAEVGEGKGTKAAGSGENGPTKKANAEADAPAGDEAGTPPPPDPEVPSTAVAKAEGDDEPGTPPPPPPASAAPASAPAPAAKSITELTSPGTPKRPREEETEDVAMQEGEATKRPRVE
ncbi:hypothetical protein JCM3774_004214 [Rhodotorula dairenensis]